MRKPTESPAIAPSDAASATHQMLAYPETASSEAATRAISPGSGMPMLSTPMTSATITYISSGGTLDNQLCTVSTESSAWGLLGAPKHRRYPGRPTTQHDPVRASPVIDATRPIIGAR